MTKPEFEEKVDHALDTYLRTATFDPDGVRTRTLAHIEGVPRAQMSNWLQQYRIVQGLRTTRYRIAGEGYGRSGRFKILSRPGRDRAVDQQTRRDHMLWVTHDMASRFARDIVHEINPALRGQAFDDAIAMALPLVEHQLDGVVQHVERALA